MDTFGYVEFSNSHLFHVDSVCKHEGNELISGEVSIGNTHEELIKKIITRLVLLRDGGCGLCLKWLMNCWEVI